MPDWHKGGALSLILLACFAAALVASMILLAAPLYALSMGASEGLLGTLVTAYVASGVVLSLPGAALCDRLGRRTLAILSFCSFAIASTVNMLAVSPSWLILGHVMSGLGDVLFTVGGLTFLTEALPRGHEDIGNSVAFSVMAAGYVAGSALGGYVAEWVSFGSVFRLSLLVSAVGACLSLGLPSVKPKASPEMGSPPTVLRSYRAAYDLLRANKTTCLVSFITGLGTVGWFTFRSSFYLDYLHQLGIPTGTIGLLTALGAGAMVLGPTLYFVISRRIGLLPAILLGLLLAGLGLAIIPFLTSVPVLAFVGTLSQAADSFRVPGVFALLRLGTRTEERATSIAILNTSWAMVAFSGGVFWRVTVEITGLSNAFLVAGLATMVGTGSFYVWSRHQWSSLTSA